MKTRFCFAECMVLLAAVAAQAQQVVVKPEPTDEILANPDMGWETFHRPSKLDKNLPPWIPSTVYYVRWGWNRLEPAPGKLNTELLDQALKAAHDSGQKLAFRVMCCSTDAKQPYQPAWLKRLGGRELMLSMTEDDRTTTTAVPDMDDPVVLDHHLDFIKRLGRRYDGNPDLSHVDLGSVGWWGEWHLSGRMPTLETRLKVVDAYLAAFKKTPLLMLVGGKECLKYAAEHGAGWRADCLGDFSPWQHMRKVYPNAIRQADLADTWKTAPVAWETCWDMRKWVAEGWSLRYIFNYALACHASYLNNKSAPLPEGEHARAELERFLRRLGYRLVLKELSYPAAARPGETLRLAMKWQNTGSAPCYRPYRVAYRLDGVNGFRKTFVGEVTVNRWLPGSVELFTPEFFREPPDLPPGDVAEVADGFALPANLPPGEYALSVAIVGERNETPVVRLGIKGRATDGWYPLSKVKIAGQIATKKSAVAGCRARSHFEAKAHSMLQALIQGDSTAQFVDSVKSLPTAVRERLGLIADADERFEVGCIVHDKTVPTQRFLGAAKASNAYFVAVEKGGRSHWWFVEQFTVDHGGHVISTKRINSEGTVRPCL